MTSKPNWAFYALAAAAGVLTFGAVILAASAVARHRERRAYRQVVAR